MKHKRTKKQLAQLEQDMKKADLWEDAYHCVSYKGPTSIRFSPEILKKLHAVASVKNKTISGLVNEYVKAFVEGEYQILKMVK